MNEYLKENYRKLAMNLLIFRKSTRLDQIAFATKCGLSRFQYLRAEGGHGNMTLQTLLKICQTFDIEIGDLFKDPFNQALKIEQREKIKIQGKSSQIIEEKYLSQINKNTSIKKLIFGMKQIRFMRLQSRVKFEILILKGELIVVFSSETTTLKEGQHLALDFNPQLSFDKKPKEHFKLASIFGAEILLIQTAIH